MANDGRVTVEEDVVYGKRGDREVRCDIYHPPGDVARAPAVVLVHGGAWRRGDRKQLRGYGILLGREGYVCVAPEYGLVPDAPWPAALHDVKAAIRFTRANADRLRIDPDRIAIEGNSAGGHLALLCAGTADMPEFEGEGGHPGVSTRVAAAIGVYAPTLICHGERQKGGTSFAVMTDEGTEEGARAASPLTYAGPHYPPTMLVHGTTDTTVPPLASMLMYDALMRAGVPVELHMYAEQPHAFDAKREYGRLCAQQMLVFLDRYVREPAAAPQPA